MLSSGRPAPSSALHGAKSGSRYDSVSPRIAVDLSIFCSLASPATILGWHRKLLAEKYSGVAARPGPGRPRAPSKAVAQLLTMAHESPTWRYTRLRALANVGYELGRSTIERERHDWDRTRSATRPRDVVENVSRR